MNIEAKIDELTAALNQMRKIEDERPIDKDKYTIWCKWMCTVDDRVEEVLKLLRSSEGVRV